MNRAADGLERAADLLRERKVQKLLGAVVLLGFAAYAVAGWSGLLVLAVALVLAAWLRPTRRRLLRWYLLG